jgi:hypothetical protein
VLWAGIPLALVVVSIPVAARLVGPGVVAGVPVVVRDPASPASRSATVEVVATPGPLGARVAGFSWVVDRMPGTVPKPVVNGRPLPEVKSLTIPTYEKSGQANHPSVIDFLAEYGMPTWGGYRYWMSMTPYPFDNDRYENPSLLASKDGVTWVAPRGIPSPLVSLPSGYRRSSRHNSDPTLVYDPGTGRLVVFYRENVGKLPSSPEVIHRIDVSFANESFSLERHSSVITMFTRDTEILSPAVVIDKRGGWHMWFVSFYPKGGAASHKGTLGLLYSASPDGLTWSPPQKCVPTLKEYYGSAQPKPYGLYGGGEPVFPWHVEAKLTGETARLLITATQLPSGASLGAGSALYLADAPLAHPTALTYPADAPIVVGAPGLAVYRAGFVAGKTYRIWYSARDGDPENPLSPGRWRIATTEGLVSTSRDWIPASSLLIAAPGLSPGTWYLHVRAVDRSGVWSDTTHVTIDAGT